MFGRFMPQEGKFFELFNAHADLVVSGGKALQALMHSLHTGQDGVAQRAAEIDDFETRADRITHDTITMLHKTFITPLDRDQIHGLVNGLDDILDIIQDVAELLALYDIRAVSEDATELADISLRCCERVKEAVGMLSNMDHAPSILKICHEIDAMESDADRVMRGAMSRLFREEDDVKEVLKQKAVYELLETISDRCEDVANIIEGIVLENS